MKRECDMCDKLFTPKCGQQRYCSKQCWLKAREEEKERHEETNDASG